MEICKQNNHILGTKCTVLHHTSEDVSPTSLAIQIDVLLRTRASMIDQRGPINLSNFHIDGRRLVPLVPNIYLPSPDLPWLDLLSCRR